MTLKKRSVFNRLIMLFLLIILPIIIISSLILIFSTNRLTKEILQSISQKTGSFVETLDNELIDINHSAAYITANSGVLKLSYRYDLLDPYEKATEVLRLQEYISSMKSNNPLINNIKVYILPLLKAFNAEGYKKGSYEDFSVKDFKRLISIQPNDPSPLLYTDSSLRMIIPSSNKDPVDIVEVELSLAHLKREFANQSMYEDSYYLFNFNNGRLILDNTDRDVFRQEILDASYDKGVADISYDGISYKAFLAKSSYINASYIQIVPADALLEPLRLSTTFTILFIFFIFLCVSFFFIGAFRLIRKPLIKLTDAFKNAKSGDIRVIEETDYEDFGYLYKSYNEMATHLNSLINEVYQQKLLIHKAEFKQLQAQINPHFLYNSFFMMHRMIIQGLQEEAAQVSAELGRYFMYITRNSRDSVTLKDEYEHAKTYSNIQSMRFQGRIETEFGELPEKFGQLQVPRLILQPILENAYNYGLENKISDGLLRVQFIPSENNIEIAIEDNGENLSDESLESMQKNFEQSHMLIDSAETTGLLNIYKRIQTFYKNGSVLMVSRSNLGGMKVTIQLIC